MHVVADNEESYGPYLVRLVTFIPGTTFVNTPYVPGSFHNVGVTLAKLHDAIADVGLFNTIV